MSVFSIVSLILTIILIIEALTWYARYDKTQKVTNFCFFVILATLIIGIGSISGVYLYCDKNEVYSEEEYDIERLLSNFTFTMTRQTTGEHRYVKHHLNRFSNADEWIVYNPENLGQKIMDTYKLSNEDNKTSEESSDIGLDALAGMFEGSEEQTSETESSPTEQ